MKPADVKLIEKNHEQMVSGFNEVLKNLKLDRFRIKNFSLVLKQLDTNLNLIGEISAVPKAAGNKLKCPKGQKLVGVNIDPITGEKTPICE